MSCLLACLSGQWVYLGVVIGAFTSILYLVVSNALLFYSFLFKFIEGEDGLYLSVHLSIASYFTPTYLSALSLFFTSLHRFSCTCIPHIHSLFWFSLLPSFSFPDLLLLLYERGICSILFMLLFCHYLSPCSASVNVLCAAWNVGVMMRIGMLGACVLKYDSWRMGWAEGRLLLVGLLHRNLSTCYRLQ